MRATIVILLCLMSLPVFSQNASSPTDPSGQAAKTTTQYDVNVGVTEQTFQAMTKSVDAMAGLIAKYVSGPLGAYYVSMVRRQATAGWTGVGFAVGSLILMCVCIGLIRRAVGPEESNDVGVMCIFWIILGVVSLLCFLVSLWCLPGSISRIAAPESFAIQEIVKSLKP